MRCFFFLPQKSCIAVWYLWALLKWLIGTIAKRCGPCVCFICRFCQSVQLPLHLTHPLVLCSSNIPSVLLETVGKHRKCWQTFSLDESEQISCRFKSHKINWFVILVGLVLELAVVFFSLFTDDVPQFIVGKWMHHEQFWGYLDNRAPPVCLLNLQITLFPALSDTSMCPLTSPLFTLDPSLSSLRPPLFVPNHDALSVSQPVPCACAAATATLQKLGQD